MRYLLTLFLAVSGFASLGQAQGEPAPVTVFAAASLRGALEEIATSFPADVTVSFAGSGTLARQLAAGAPADIVILAHVDWMAWLEDRGLILPDSRADVASGQLVLIGPAGAQGLEQVGAPDILTALDGGRLAIGQRDGVPAGSYARDWLRSIGAWEQITPHLAETDNVRAALALVAVGAAPLGVVYASDAAAEPRVAIRYAIPPATHAPIRYPAAAVNPSGTAFLHHLQQPSAVAIFAAHGFVP